MKKGLLALILLDAKPNRHSLNALVAALETDESLNNLELHLPASEARLQQHLGDVLSRGTRAIVGLSFTTSRLRQIRELMLRLKGRAQQAIDRSPHDFSQQLPVLWLAGGPHPTADPEGSLRLGFDVVVHGEGEATLLGLLNRIATGGDWTAVSGISFRDPSGQTRDTGRRPAVNLDAFPPFPLRLRRVVGPIEITRGCPFACAYCQTSHLLGGQPRHRSIDTIAQYAAVIRQRGLRDVRVISPNAFSYGSPDGKTLNLPALESLLSTLRQTLGRDGRLYFGTFPSEVRPEHVNEATLELVKRHANNESLIIGAQSGSDKMLEHCGRGHSVADVVSAVARTVAAGLKPHVDFIFGLPGEREEDRRDTLEVIQELVALGALIHAHTFFPLPQSRFAEEPPGTVERGLRPFIRELIRNGVLYGIESS